MAHRRDGYGPGGGGRHRWVAEPATGPVLMGKHADTPEGRADDWIVDERDEHAHDDDGCDQAQEQPDRWIGADRDLDLLPLSEATETDELGGPLHA